MKDSYTIFESRLKAAGLDPKVALRKVDDEKRWHDFCNQIYQDAPIHFILFGERRPNRPFDDYLPDKQWNTVCELVANTKTITTLELRCYFFHRGIDQFVCYQLEVFCRALEKNTSLKTLTLYECGFEELRTDMWDNFWGSCKKNKSLRTLKLPLNYTYGERRWSEFCEMFQTQCTFPIIDLSEHLFEKATFDWYLDKFRAWNKFVNALYQNPWIQKVIIDPEDVEPSRKNDVNTLNTLKAITRHRVALTLGHCLQISRNLPMQLISYILTYIDYSQSLSTQVKKDLEAHAKNLSSRQPITFLNPTPEPKSKAREKRSQTQSPKRKPWR